LNDTFFFSAPQLKRDPLGSARRQAMSNSVFLLLAMFTANLGGQLAGMTDSNGTFQYEFVRAESLPAIRGPTVIAIVQEPLDSALPDLRAVQAIASALGYDFVLASERVPRYASVSVPPGSAPAGTAIYLPDGRPSGYALVDPRRTHEFVRGLAATGALRRAFRAFRQSVWVNWYWQLWPVALLSAVLIVASLTPASQRKALWVPVTEAFAAISLALVAPSIIAQAANPFHNMLQRDVVAAFVLAVGVPLLVGWTAFLSQGASTAYRVLLPSAIAVCSIAASPLYALLIHCTSGDCL